MVKKADYTPTSQEQALLEAHIARREDKPPPPRMTVTKKAGVQALDLDHPDPTIGLVLLMDALGTHNPDFYGGLIEQLARPSSKGYVDDLNFMLSVITGVEPKDQVEAMLAAQMAAVHVATMTFARRLAHVDNIPQQDSAERAFNKLARTFATQVEALKRYRTGGQQMVRVEHVTVNEGGQAIVGNVTGGRGAPKKQGTTP